MSYKNKRVQILQEQLKNRVDFSRVFMTDGNMFRLDGPFNWFSYYVRKGNKQMPLLRQQGGSSIMCHCTALSDGQFNIIFCPKALNSDSYIILLEKDIIPYIKNHMRNDFTLQQDNALFILPERSRNFLTNSNNKVLK